MNTANETFDLPANSSIRFYTQELAGNRGWNVEITRTVWEAVRSILTSVIVESKVATPEARKTPRKSIAPPQPDRVVTHEAGAAPTPEVIDAARRLSRISIAPGDAQRRASRRSFAPRASLAPPTSGNDRAGSPRGGDALVKEEDDDEEVVLRSSRGANKRQVIASEDEDTEDEEGFDDDDDDSEDDDMIDDEAIEDGLQDDNEEDVGEDIGEEFFVSAKGSHAEQEPSPAPAPPPPKTPASKAERRASEQRSNGRC